MPRCQQPLSEYRQNNEIRQASKARHICDKPVQYSFSAALTHHLIILRVVHVPRGPGRQMQMTILWKDNEWFLENLILGVLSKFKKRRAGCAQIARPGLCYHEANLFQAACNFPWVHVVISRHSKA